MIEEAAASKQAKRLLLPCATGLVELAASLVNHALANAQQWRGVSRQQLLVASGDGQAGKKTMEGRGRRLGGRFRSAGLETGMEHGTRQRRVLGWSMIHSRGLAEGIYSCCCCPATIIISRLLVLVVIAARRPCVCLCARATLSLPPLKS